MDVADYVVLGIHFLATVIIGAVSAWKSKRDSTVGYFLANSSGHWILIGFSIFMTNIGSIAAIGLPGAAAATGIPVIVYELFGTYGILIMGFVFVPIFSKANVFTAPEYLRKRFGGQRLQVYMSIQTIIMQILMKIPAEIYAGALTIEVLLQWNRYISISVMLGAVTIATIVGGLSTVMVTDTFQGIVMLVGGLILAIICYLKFPSLDILKLKYMASISSEILMRNNTNSSCGIPDPYAFHILRPVTDINYPWPGTIGGGLIICIAYFSVNQDLLQRCFSAKNLFHAQMGAVLASFLKLTPTFIFLLPGFIGRISFPDIVACANASTCAEMCHNPGGCSNLVYPLLIKYFAPTVIRGIVLAAILASIMSTLTSVFNSGSTLVVIDIWKKFRPTATVREELLVGRIVVFIYAGLALGFIPILDTSEGGQLFHYTQSLSAYLFPPTLIIFTIAILWQGCNESGAFWSLMIGLALGLTRMILSFVMPAPPCGHIDNRPAIIRDFHYLHFGIFLLVLCGVCAIIISLVTKTNEDYVNSPLTWNLTCCRKKTIKADLPLKMNGDAEIPGEDLTFNVVDRRWTHLTWGLGCVAALLSTGIFLFFH